MTSINISKQVKNYYILYYKKTNCLFSISLYTYSVLIAHSISKLKKSRIQETLTLSTCADNSFVSPNKNQTIWADSEHLLVFKALCGDDPEQNSGKIHASNVEHLPVFKAPRGTIWN